MLIISKRYSKRKTPKVVPVTPSWALNCPLEQGGLYINPIRPTIKRLIISEPKWAKISNYRGYVIRGWSFTAMVIRNGKTMLRKLRVRDLDVKQWIRLEDHLAKEEIAAPVI